MTIFSIAFEVVRSAYFFFFASEKCESELLVS
jgi:hypothetical protein